MSDNAIDVKLGADASALKTGMAEASHAVKEATVEMKEHLESLNGVFEAVRSHLALISTVLAGGAIFKESIAATNKWNTEVVGLSKSLGITTQQASVWAVALDHIGVSSDTVKAATFTMSRMMLTNADAFEKMGIEIETSTGHMRPANEVMQEALEKLRGITNVVVQNQAGMKLFGRGWAEIKPLLKLTSDQMVEAKEVAERLHLIVGPEGAAMTRQYGESQRDLKMIGESLEIQMGSKLLPVMVKLGKFMGEEGPSMGDTFASMLEHISFLAQETWLALKWLGEGLGAVAAEAVALAHWDLAAVKQIGEERYAQSQQTKKEMADLWNDLGKPLPEPKSAKGKADDGNEPDFTKTTKAKAETRLSIWKDALEQQKVMEENYGKDYQESELKFWEGKLKLTKTGGKEYLAVHKEIYTLKKAMWTEANNKEKADQKQKDQDDEAQFKELIKQSEERIKTEIDDKTRALETAKKISDDEFKVEEDNLAKRVKAGQISGDDELTALNDLTDRKHEANQIYYGELASLREVDSKETKDFYAKAELDDAAYHAEILKNATKSAEDQKKIYQDMFKPMTSALDKSITGMIMGTQTLKQALGNIFQSILAEFVNNLVKKMVDNWLAGELQKIAATKAGSVMRSALEAAGFITTEVAKTAADTTTTAGTLTTAAVTIPAEAAEAAGGAASAVAGIPIVGPELAAAAYAETYAMVMGGMASASGGYDIPAGVNPLTQLHQREMVLPAEHADTIRGLGGNDSNNSVVHIHAESVSDTVKVRELSRLFKQMNRNFVLVGK